MQCNSPRCHFTYILMASARLILLLKPESSYEMVLFFRTFFSYFCLRKGPCYPQVFFGMYGFLKHAQQESAFIFLTGWRFKNGLD